MSREKDPLAQAIHRYANSVEGSLAIGAVRNFLLAVGAVLLFQGAQELHEQQQETREYKTAVSEATKTMQATTAEEIMSCNLENVAVQQMKKPGHHAHTRLKIGYKIDENPEIENNKWLRNGGTVINGDIVQVTWRNQMTIEHTLASDKTSYNNVMFSPTENGHHAITYIMQDRIEGRHTLEPGIDITFTGTGYDFDSDSNRLVKPLFASCGKIALGVQDDKVTIIDREPVTSRAAQ